MVRRYSNKAWFLVSPAALVIGAIGFVPLMATVNYSVQDSFAGDHFIWVGLRWYEEMFRSTAFWGALGRTLLFTIITLTIQFGLGIFVARKLYYIQKRGELFIGLIVLPLLAPWIVVGFVWRHVMNPEAGLIGVLGASIGFAPDLNSVYWVWGTIIAMDVWHWTSLIVILCYAGYLGIPRAYFQAASIDGASSWATFRHIEFPKLRRVLLIALLLRMADSMMIYTEPLMISRGGPNVSSTFMSQELIRTAMQEFNFGEAGALSVFYLALITSIAWALYSTMRLQDD